MKKTELLDRILSLELDRSRFQEAMMAGAKRVDVQANRIDKQAEKIKAQDKELETLTSRLGTQDMEIKRSIKRSLGSRNNLHDRISALEVTVNGWGASLAGAKTSPVTADSMRLDGVEHRVDKACNLARKVSEQVDAIASISNAHGSRLDALVIRGEIAEESRRLDAIYAERTRVMVHEVTTRVDVLTEPGVRTRSEVLSYAARTRAMHNDRLLALEADAADLTDPADIPVTEGPASDFTHGNFDASDGAGMCNKLSAADVLAMKEPRPFIGSITIQIGATGTWDELAERVRSAQAHCPGGCYVMTIDEDCPDWVTIAPTPENEVENKPHPGPGIHNTVALGDKEGRDDQRQELDEIMTSYWGSDHG